MSWLIVPFETRRRDARSGAFARQVPALLAEGLQQAGESASVRWWFARRADAVAHVVFERPVPTSILLREARRTGCAGFITGTLIEGDEGWDASVTAWRTDDGQRSWEVRAQSRSLHSVLQELWRGIGAQLGGDLRWNPALATDTSLAAWLLDQDQRIWLQEAGIEAIRGRADLHNPLIPALHEPESSEWAVGVLVERVRDWMQLDAHEAALNAAVHGFEIVPDSQALWSLAVAAIERLPDAEREPWYRRVVAASPLRASSHLHLGVHLLRMGEARKAVTPLQAAMHHAEHGEPARAYLGIALAQSGKPEEAIALWRQILDSGTHPVARRIAEENLSRAGVHPA